MQGRHGAGASGALPAAARHPEPPSGPDAKAIEQFPAVPPQADEVRSISNLPHYNSWACPWTVQYLMEPAKSPRCLHLHLKATWGILTMDQGAPLQENLQPIKQQARTVLHADISCRKARSIWPAPFGCHPCRMQSDGHHTYCEWQMHATHSQVPLPCISCTRSWANDS